MPCCDTEAMNLHLAEIATQIAPHAHAAVLVDQAGRLSNRIFKSFDDIVDHCCDAWNKLIDQPWRIMSIGMRD